MGDKGSSEKKKKRDKTSTIKSNKGKGRVGMGWRLGRRGGGVWAGCLPRHKDFLTNLHLYK